MNAFATLDDVHVEEWHIITILHHRDDARKLDYENNGKKVLKK